MSCGSKYITALVYTNCTYFYFEDIWIATHAHQTSKFGVCWRKLTDNTVHRGQTLPELHEKLKTVAINFLKLFNDLYDMQIGIRTGFSF